jgi:hypothetical protein
MSPSLRATTPPLLALLIPGPSVVHPQPFGETLASARSGGSMGYTLPVVAPLPMYPNRALSSSLAKQAFRSPLPVQNATARLGDGMSGRLGRIM